jgi:hypothetical protein
LALAAIQPDDDLRHVVEHWRRLIDDHLGMLALGRRLAAQEHVGAKAAAGAQHE